MSLSLPTGTTTSYPYQFGRVFKQGVIANYPQVLIDGAAQTTQADVKNRWPDGSVKFAILSLIVPSLSTSAKTFTFQNQATVNSTPETKANMLASYDFNCAINATQCAAVNSSLTFNVTSTNVPTVDSGGNTIAQPIYISGYRYTRPQDGGAFMGYTGAEDFTITNGSTANPTLVMSSLTFGGAYKIVVRVSMSRNDYSAASNYNGQGTQLTIVRSGVVSGIYSGSVYPMMGYLTNENPLIPCDSSGTFSSLSAASGTFKLFKSNADVTTSGSFSVVSQTSCTVSISATTGAYTVSGLTADTGTAVLRGTYGGETVDLTLSIVKSKAGTSTPAQANAAIIVLTCTSTQVFQFNSNSSGTALTGAPVSARTMLNAVSDATLASNTGSDSPDSRYWTQGPICTTVILNDHTNKTYDFGTTAEKSLRPIYHVQFWPTLGKYKVRVLVENADVSKLHAQVYDAFITTGNASPATVYSRASIPHNFAGRWTKSFWSGTAPVAINANHNSVYLSNTRAIANYDPTTLVSESKIADRLTTWNATATDIFDKALWNKIQPDVGGRSEIALVPGWHTDTMLSGDYRLQQISDGQTELSLAWPVHLRESNASKKYNYVTTAASPVTQTMPGTTGQISGVGWPVTVFARPTQFYFDNNYIQNGGQLAADQYTWVGGQGVIANGWSPDCAHQPATYIFPYLTTGEYVWLEEMQFWASWSAFNPQASTTGGFYGRGPTLTSGATNGSIRRRAWALRSRADAAAFSVDGSKEKTYYEYLLNDAIAILEGTHGVTGSAFQGNAAYNWGVTVARPDPEIFSTLGISPIRFLDNGQPDAGTFGYFYPGTWNTPATGNAPWQMSYMVISLAHCKDLGYAADSILSYCAAFFTEALKVNATAPLVAQFALPLVKTGPPKSWVGSWADTLALYANQTTPKTTADSTITSSDGPNSLAACAVATVYDLTDGVTAYNWIKTNWIDTRPGPGDFGGYYYPWPSQWSIIPRT
jgi:hypothetical protein